MGVGTSIFLIALGAILRWGVTTSVSGVSLQTIGLILLLVGIAGLILSLFYMAFWADRTTRRGAYVERPVVRERETL